MADEGIVTVTTGKVEVDAAYQERNRLVALLARLYPSGLKRTDIPGWDPEWHGCVYIDLPTGQASWHYHDRDAHLFDGLPPYQGEWDGHSTEEKYDRVSRAHNCVNTTSPMSGERSKCIPAPGPQP